VNKTGVYTIRCISTGAIYVGSAAASFKKRWHIHLSDLRNGKHHNSRLQRLWNKHGEDSFEFTIAEVCLPEHCIAQEQVFIDYYVQQCPANVLNLQLVAGSSKGCKRTPEQRARQSEITKNLPKEVRDKMRASLTGQKRSEETKARIRELKSKKEIFTPEVRQKMSESAKVRKRDPETYRKAADARRGIPLSEETKRKIGEANRGRVMSQEQRDKLSVISKNMSPEQRKKIGDASRGRVDSPETRERRRLSQIARHARDRAAKEAVR
jgi:group I intron endonuclease